MKLHEFQKRLQAAGRIAEGAKRGRYAPSPSGAQHLGNARTALLAWLQIRLEAGTFILRMEDLDRPREVSGSAVQIVDDLEWMGLDWDEGAGSGGALGPYLQSERDELYEAALSMIRENGRAFPCVCSRKDIRLASSAPHGSSPVYPGTCRDLAMYPGGRPPAWRFRVPCGLVTVDDQVCGKIVQDVQGEVGDFVLKRSDGLFAYQLAVVIDDAMMGITDVLRGLDLLDSAPRQVLLYRAIGAPEPGFWHVPMMLGDDGHRMAKRFGSRTVQSFREEGGSPRELVGLLASSIGLVRDGEALLPRDLLQRCDTPRLLECLRNAALRSSD